MAGAFGLLVSLVKTKLMVTGHAVQEENRTPIQVGDGEIENVKFTYLGSLIANSGRMDADVDRHIVSVSKAFGALCSAVLKDRHLITNTKWKVYGEHVCSQCCYMFLSAGRCCANITGSSMPSTTTVSALSLELPTSRSRRCTSHLR